MKSLLDLGVIEVELDLIVCQARSRARGGVIRIKYYLNVPGSRTKWASKNVGQYTEDVSYLI